MCTGVKLAFGTKKEWDNENLIEHGFSVLPKKFGVNRTPKFFVNVANFFLKRPIDFANELFRGTKLL